MVEVTITDSGVSLSTSVKIHPAADLFPLLTGDDFDALVQDIDANGLREPVVFTPAGELLDGRNRWKACKKLGDEPPRRVEHSEPYAYVISTNLHRRHLSESQRAMIGAKIADRHDGQRGAPRKAVSVDTASPRPKPEPLPPSRSEAARLLNVGTASISRGRVVLQEGTESLRNAVVEGQIPVSTAARIASEMEPEDQESVVARIRNGEPARNVAPPDMERWVRKGRARQNSGIEAEEPPARRAVHMRERHRYIGLDALRAIRDSLNALEPVLDTTEGISPEIGPEEAGRWVDDLMKARRNLAPLISRLKERANTP